MALTLAPLTGRSRELPWFVDDDTERLALSAAMTPSRDEMFVDERLIAAYLTYALAQTHMGQADPEHEPARVNLERLESQVDPTIDQPRPTVVAETGMAVNYFDPLLDTAVLTSMDGRRVIAIRTDAITHIEIATP